MLDWPPIGIRATLATLTRTIRYRTRFQRRIVMQRTSTISENAEPSTTTAKTANPPTGFQSHRTSAAFGCTRPRYRLAATTDDTTVASTPQVKITCEARDRSAEKRASDTGRPRPAR